MREECIECDRLNVCTNSVDVDLVKCKDYKQFVPKTLTREMAESLDKKIMDNVKEGIKFETKNKRVFVIDEAFKSGESPKHLLHIKDTESAGFGKTSPKFNLEMRPLGEHPTRLGVFVMKENEPGRINEIDREYGFINTTKRELWLNGSTYFYGTGKDFNKESEEVDIEVLVAGLRAIDIYTAQPNLQKILRLVDALRKDPDLSLKDIILNLKT